jgi:RNA polymerase sigma-19 factor, ECF subfamily
MSRKRRPPPERLRAWLEAYSKLHPRARARSLRGANDAEDLLHDAFLRASRTRSSIADRTAYLARTEYHGAASAARRASRSIVSFDSEKMADAIETHPEMHIPDMTEELALLQRLRVLVMQMPAQKMRAFTLCRWYGYSYKEAAERLGLSVETVHKYVGEVYRQCTELRMELRRGGTDK